MRLSFRSILLCFIGSCSLLLIAGCGSKPAATPDAKPPERGGGSVDNLLKESAPPPTQDAPPTSAVPGAPDQTEQTAAAAPAATSGADTSTMTQVDPQAYVKLTYSLFKFKEKYQRMPRDWDEVISTRFLDKLPPAPAGKRYAFDPSCTVYLK